MQAVSYNLNNLIWINSLIINNTLTKMQILPEVMILFIKKQWRLLLGEIHSQKNKKIITVLLSININNSSNSIYCKKITKKMSSKYIQIFQLTEIYKNNKWKINIIKKDIQTW